ncbi:hypothetical protein MGI18_22245 [Bacillus sp. OVS6]|nr:hypothetical protein MGI18_22245 [Bacillus sp. OVS6]
MKTVLKRMYAKGFISQKEYEEAATFDLRKSLAKAKPSSFEQYPWLTYEIEERATDIILTQLAEKDGHKLDELKKIKNCMQNTKPLLTGTYVKMAIKFIQPFKKIFMTK